MSLRPLCLLTRACSTLSFEVSGSSYVICAIKQHPTKLKLSYSLVGQWTSTFHPGWQHHPCIYPTCTSYRKMLKHNKVMPFVQPPHRTGTLKGSDVAPISTPSAIPSCIVWVPACSSVPAAVLHDSMSLVSTFQVFVQHGLGGKLMTSYEYWHVHATSTQTITTSNTSTFAHVTQNLKRKLERFSRSASPTCDLCLGLRQV